MASRAPADRRARLEPWATGTTLSPVARPSAFALRATADKSRRRCAPPRDEDEGADGRPGCKQQRIYKRFTSMAACSVATRPSPNEKSRPEAARLAAFICGSMAQY